MGVTLCVSVISNCMHINFYNLLRLLKKRLQRTYKLITTWIYRLAERYILLKKAYNFLRYFSQPDPVYEIKVTYRQRGSVEASTHRAGWDERKGGGCLGER